MKKMWRSLYLIIVLAVFSGCATTQPSAVDRLQIKLTRLERKLTLREKQIDDMSYEIKMLNQRINGVETYPPVEPVDENLTFSLKTSPQRTESEEDIIRVPVSVNRVQTALKNAGYYEGDVDGKIGRKTKKAIGAFQKDHELQIDGIIGKNTWEELKKYLE